MHPGANLILVDSEHVPKPAQDGYMVRFVPNLRYALPNGKCCGKIPYVSVSHLHHGVWLSTGGTGRGEGEGNSYGGLYPFMATGAFGTTSFARIEDLSGSPRDDLLIGDNRSNRTPP